MAETGPALAVADHDQRREAEALAALHRLGHAVDVDELFDQLLAAIVVAATAATAIVAAATAAATIATATAATAATGHGRHADRGPAGSARGWLPAASAGAAALQRPPPELSPPEAVGGSFARVGALSAFSRQPFRTPVRLRGQRRRGP